MSIIDIYATVRYYLDLEIFKSEVFTRGFELIIQKKKQFVEAQNILAKAK